MKYLIDVGPFHPLTGGVVALHKLAHNLRLLNKESFVRTNCINPEWNCVPAHDNLTIDDTVVIYPEVVIGNPLGAKHVVRWILNQVGVVGGDSSTWGHSDLAFTYSSYFSGKEKDRISGELRAYDLKLDFWHDQKRKRNGECYIVRKGKNKVLNQHSSNSINIDSYTNESAFEHFNNCERFVCYDSECFLAVQAALCGCLTIVIPRDGVTREEWKERFPYFRYGIAYGYDDIDHAVNTIGLVRDHLIELESETLALTKDFIDICEKRFS